MVDKNQSQNWMQSPSRRTFLKKTSSGAALLGVGAIGNAAAVSEKTIFEVVREADALRRRTDSHERFRQYIQNHGFGVSYSQNKFAHINSKKSDKSTVGIERVRDKHMTGTLTLSHNASSGNAVATYVVEVSSGNLNGPGTMPEDHVTISWPHSDFDLIEDGTNIYEGPNVLLKSSGFNGADWDWDDQGACGYGCDLDFTVSTEMKYLNPDSPPRKVQATYQSVWEDSDGGGALSGFSVGIDGSVGWSSPSYSDVDYEQLDRQVVAE